MRIYTKSEFYLIPQLPISQENISKARYEYGNHKPHPPHEIRMGAGALRDMCFELGRDVPARITNESIQGMLIKVDPTIDHNLWMIGYSDERHTAVKS